MINRSNFLSAALGSVLAAIGLPPKADEQPVTSLWPTEVPFPCEWPDRRCGTAEFRPLYRHRGTPDCHYCRLRYNAKAVEVLRLAETVVVAEYGWGWRAWRDVVPYSHPFPDGTGRRTYPANGNNDIICKSLFGDKSC